MLHYQLINEKKAIQYLHDSNYDQLWFENLQQRDDKATVFYRPVHTFGIYEKGKLFGLIIIENWKVLYEPHIFANKEIRGRRLLRLIQTFLRHNLKSYKILIGRVKKDRKDVMKLAKWLKFKHFKEDDKYYYVGVDYESF